ncbi:MAG: PH domain-containing protein, partial [Pseudomonadota bacterium]
MTEAPWRRVSPLAVLFYLAQLARVAVRQGFQVAVPAAAVLASTGGFTAGRLYLAAAVAAVVACVVAVARYVNFRYRIGDDSIVVRSGVLAKNQLNIRYDRIQAINASQSPVYRLFNVVNLQLDTPGSAQSEADLPAVGPDIVDTLRERVRAAGRAR